MWIKDLQTGTVREYGKNCHDSLRISGDGRTLTYYNLQCGDGSGYGDFRFVVDPEGHTPDEDETLIKYWADAYFNIGGWNVPKWTKYDDDDPKTWPEDGGWYIWQHKRGGTKILRWKQDAENHFYPDPYMWDVKDMVAWMPMPEPYREAEK